MTQNEFDAATTPLPGESWTRMAIRTACPEHDESGRPCLHRRAHRWRCLFAGTAVCSDGEYNCYHAGPIGPVVGY